MSGFENWDNIPPENLLGALDEIDESKAKGLTVDALRKSRSRRESVYSKFGFIPTSILKRDPREQVDITVDDFIVDRGGGYERHNKEMRAVIRRMGEGYVPGLENTGLRIQGRRGYLSRFPQSVGFVLIEIYCPERGLIYDPFAGHNSRMQLCFRNERSYVGVDICKEYMRHNRELRDVLLNNYTSGKSKLTDDPFVPSITLIEGSSAKVDLPSNHADFTITSPPYWDLEYYGPEPEQLGSGRTYGAFMDALYPHILENYRILKPGAFCIWCINDFRKNKVFHAFHIDLYNLFSKAGFVPFNIYIIDLVSVVQASFVRDIEEHKIIPKQHEYILVFRKPGGEDAGSKKKKLIRRSR